MENESWEKVGEALDAEMSSVEDVRFDLAPSVRIFSWRVWWWTSRRSWKRFGSRPRTLSKRQL